MSSRITSGAAVDAGDSVRVAEPVHASSDTTGSTASTASRFRGNHLRPVRRGFTVPPRSPNDTVHTRVLKPTTGREL